MTVKAMVAAHLDLSTSRLKGLILEKVLDDSKPGEMDLDAARVNYIRYLRAQASGRGGDRLSAARARWERASVAAP